METPYFNFELEELETANTDDLRAQIQQDANLIASRTPLDQESWHDPQNWQSEAIRLAHAVKILFARKDTQQ